MVRGVQRTHEQYVAQLSDRSLEVLGTYIKSHDKIRHRCLECGHEWDAMPSNVLSGHGCPVCTRDSKGPDEYARKVRDLDIKPIGKYQGRSVYIDHKCLLCGHVWSSRPDNILKGGNCPKCQTDRDLDKEKVYLIQAGKYTKIGVSENPRQRMKGMQCASPFGMKLILTFDTNGNDAYFIEHMLHDRLHDFQSTGEWFKLNRDAIEIILYVADDFGLYVADTDKDLLKEVNLQHIGEEDSEVINELLTQAPLSVPLQRVVSQYGALSNKYLELLDRHKDKIEGDEYKILAEQYHDLYIENSELKEEVAILQDKLENRH